MALPPQQVQNGLPRTGDLARAGTEPFGQVRE
jgi:hypothetical protein